MAGTKNYNVIFLMKIGFVFEAAFSTRFFINCSSFLQHVLSTCTVEASCNYLLIINWKNSEIPALNTSNKSPIMLFTIATQQCT